MNKKFKILQINSGNYGSTGNIMLNISKKIEEYEHVSYISYANSRTNKKKKLANSILIGNKLERNLHLKLAYYTGLNGCFSNLGTKKFLMKIDELKPDIIHLHNLHNCYINLKALFNYIKSKKIPVVWTLHDCWAFTGQCTHFTKVECDRWKTGCFDCPQYQKYPSSLLDKTKKMYEEKKKWFTGVENLTLVTPSHWLANKVSQSFLKDYKVEVVNNGIDLRQYKPTPSNFRHQHGIQDKHILLLGVADGWTESKGLNIFMGLSKKISDKYKIVLVGLSNEQIKELPSNIIGFPKTSNIKELVEIYSAADWFINPSLEETMSLVTIEALACGTPAIVSNSTAVPETVDSKCGVVVDHLSVEHFARAIEALYQPFLEGDCIDRAKKYDMNVKFNEYINIYKKLI